MKTGYQTSRPTSVTHFLQRGPTSQMWGPPQWGTSSCEAPPLKGDARPSESLPPAWPHLSKVPQPSPNSTTSQGQGFKHTMGTFHSRTPSNPFFFQMPCLLSPTAPTQKQKEGYRRTLKWEFTISPWFWRENKVCAQVMRVWVFVIAITVVCDYCHVPSCHLMQGGLSAWFIDNHSSLG